MLEKPSMFLKRPDGRLSLWSYAIYAPYHVLNGLIWWGFSRLSKENALDQIDQHVYLGRRLGSAQPLHKAGIRSVLDLTCEFGEVAELRQLAYRCIPVLDTGVPSLESLKSAVHWIVQQSTQGPVYVHCALGHGRSATVVAAYLLLSGQSATVQEAVQRLQRVRPGVGLNRMQMDLLETVHVLVAPPSHPATIMPKKDGLP